MKEVAFLFPTNRSGLAREVREKVSPDNGLYGLKYFYDLGYESSFMDVSPKWQRFLDVILWPFDKLFRSQIDIGFQFGRALLSLTSMNKADVVLTNTDSIGLPVCFLKRLGLVKSPIVYAVGLFYIQGKLKEAIDGGKNTLFRKLYKWVLGASDHIIYHSPIEKEKLAKLGLYNPTYCTFVAMGSDGEFFKERLRILTSNPQSSALVLSVGRDYARDYETLFSAAKKLPDTQFVVICSKKNIDKLEIPENVNVLLDLSYKEIVDWYRKAIAIVIPMKEMWRSSGQMTLTDSIQMGKAIIASDVVGISHYQLKNKDNVLLVPPESPEKLAKAVKLILNDKPLRMGLERSVLKLTQRFSTKNYACDIARIVDAVCDSVVLKPISAKDLEFLRCLRNENRQYFLNNTYITKSDQIKWFKIYKKKDNDRMFILVDGKKKIGMGAIYNIDNKNKSAEIGRFVIGAVYQRKGYGGILLRKIQKAAFEELGLKKLRASVFSDNKKAISLYKKNGFYRESLDTARNKNVIWMTKTI